MQPGRHQNGAHTLSNHGHIFRRDAVLPFDMLHKRLNISHGCAQAGTVSALAGTVAVTASIPGEISIIVKPQLIGHKHHATRMLVSTMKQNNSLVITAIQGRAIAIEKFRSVSGNEFFLLFHHHGTLAFKKKKSDYESALDKPLQTRLTQV